MATTILNPRDGINRKAAGHERMLAPVIGFAAASYFFARAGNAGF
jgi:hypothetical protein